jgi:hypothetical protein
MANMSYCRFHNTLSDLRDCEDYIEDPLSDSGYDSEFRSRKALIMKCYDIVEQFIDSDGKLDIEAIDNLPVEKE